MSSTAIQTVGVPRTRRRPPEDPIVSVEGVTWEQYVALRDADDRASIHMTYLDGFLEIMSTSKRHERYKKLTARLVEAYADEMGINLDGVGSATFRRAAKQAGLEPDECYFLGDGDEFPDLAIEIVITSGTIDKLEVYRRLDVREVWFFIDGRFRAYFLQEGTYMAVPESRILPGMDLAAVAKLIRETKPGGQSAAVRAFRDSLRRQAQP